MFSRPHVLGIATRLALVLALAATASPSQTGNSQKASKATSPEAVVRALYQDHFAHDQNWEETYKRQRQRFAPELCALLDEDKRAAAAAPDEIVGLDFNPFTYAQEEATAFRIASTKRDGANAIVSVALGEGDLVTEVRIRLAPSGSDWLVTNILYEEDDLASILRELAAERRNAPGTPQPEM